MKATNGRNASTIPLASPVSAGPLLPPDEGSAAYEARVRVDGICRELDAMRERQPVAARVAECLLLRELATRLAPVMLDMMTATAAYFDRQEVGPLLGRRHGEDEAERLVPRRAEA